ncbi:PIN domain-like protein [Scleroderma yunnanense]
MGVLGLTPFLLKTCPQVIKKLPDRLRSLQEKTIVIDGTLITQRLHFAPMPHHHRHVLGWYRILTELKECGVRAICVFDGQQRSAAKAREVERRKEIHRMDSARYSIETTRLHRLQQLMHLLPHYRSLRASDRRCITEGLGKMTDLRLPSSHAIQDTCYSGSTVPRRNADSTTQAWSASSHLDPRLHEYGSFTGEDLNDALGASNQQLFAVAHHHEASGFYEADQDGSTLDFSEYAQASHLRDDPATASPMVFWGDVADDTARHWSFDVPSASEEPCLQLEDIKFAFSTLYGEFRKGLDQITSIPSPFDVPVTSDFMPDPTEAGIEYAMSKSQLQMTMDEGRIWKLIASSSLPPEAEETLMSLASKSSTISYSYYRRTNLPSSETYDECKEIIHSMGVPCIAATGSFEAEALASSLVIHGHADFVASEDTDVLVYGAPLIRNIANRDSPLIVVSGSDVRNALELDRSSFIDFILLLGTDFSQRIKNVGPQRALKFIKEYGSIEGVVEHEAKYPPRIPTAAYLAQVEVARTVFNTLPPVPALELLQPFETNPLAVSYIIQKYNLQRVLHEHWDHRSALAGNYFQDDPSVTYL